MLSKKASEVRYLTDKELEIFRRDYQDKEREIQRYIGVYLSGLVLVTGWIIGPQSRPLLLMALGNGGYNLYAFLIIVVLNIVFTNFLIYKSIIVHEITQFMTVVAKPDSGFLYWDSWRRSPQSATKPVRAIYTLTLGVLPIAVSVLMMFGVWSILKADPNQLANRLSELETPIASGASDSTGTRGSAASVSDRDQARSTSATTEQLHIKLENVWIWFWIVLALHSIPLAFFYVNVFPTNKRWTRILSIRGTLSLFDNLKESSAPKLIPSGKIRLINNETNELVGEVSHEQLGFLIENFEEESALDDAYYIQKATLEMLERNESDSDLIRLLRKAIGKKEGIEVRWERG